MDPDTPRQVLLIIIMSYLAFRDAARTSVLSRYWQNMWRGTRNIEFNERFFSYVGDDEDDRRGAFVTFVQNWITHYEPSSLDKLSILVHRPVDFLLLMEESIEFAIRRGVKVLGLDFSDPAWGDEVLKFGNNPEPAFVLPPFFYAHEVLESLSLFSCNFNPAAMINFNLLKQLTLGWIELPLPSLSMLLQNFPLLESLSLKNCWNTGGLQIVGQELRLRSLDVDKFIMYENPWIEIVAPNLKHLKYSGTMAVLDVSAGELEDAYFEFGLENEGDEAMGDRLYQLLHQLPAKILTVCTYMLQVLPLELGSDGVAPMLGVGKLTLRTAMLTCEQRGLQYLLCSCPFLQALIIQIVPERIVDLDGGEPDEDGDIWTRPNTPDFYCVKETLKAVQVRGYRGTRHEVGFVKYLICRARVIQKLHVQIGNELQNQRSMAENHELVAQTFRGLRKASSNLRFSIFGR